MVTITVAAMSIVVLRARLRLQPRAISRAGIDWGVYGVPETYVIDKAGVIRYKQIGPITEEALREKILPLLKGLQ